jgi:hypothetical protein
MEGATLVIVREDSPESSVLKPDWLSPMFVCLPLSCDLEFYSVKLEPARGLEPRTC